MAPVDRAGRDHVLDDAELALDGGDVAQWIRGACRGRRRIVCRRDLRSQRRRSVGRGRRWCEGALRPRLTDDFVDPRLPIDITDLHTYAVEWGEGASSFFVDDEIVHRSPQSPTYPMQVMVAVFDFPDWSSGGDDRLVPELVVRSIAGATDTGSSISAR